MAHAGTHSLLGPDTSRIDPSTERGKDHSGPSSRVKCGHLFSELLR